MKTNKKQTTNIAKIMLAFFVVMLCVSLFPVSAVADEIPMGSLTIDEIIVDPSEASQGASVDVTLNAS